LPVQQAATAVQGSVKLTDVATCSTATRNPGDSWFVTQSSELVRDIQSDFFIRDFRAVVNQASPRNPVASTLDGTLGPPPWSGLFFKAGKRRAERRSAIARSMAFKEYC
jgi:hypothetical protein